MAPAPPGSWAGLKIEVLLLIVAKLACLADRSCFAAVCHRWAEAAQLAKLTRPLPSQIPWLLLPSPSPTPSMFSFLSGVRRRIRSFPADFARERLCGSYPGGWVAAALGPFGRHLLANVYSGVRISLPDRMLHVSFSTITPVMVRAIALSAAPTAMHCVAGAMVSGVSNIAFCRPGVDPHWFTHGEMNLQDMIYYAGEALQGFHVLMSPGDVRVITFNVTHVEGRPSIMQSFTMNYKMPGHAFDALLSALPTATMRTGYLVVSREKLLMVMRYYTRCSQIEVRRTLLFRVFELEVQTSSGSRQPRASWKELDGLDGRVLFVGRGCSRAYEASELQGFGGGSVYYLDDAEFHAMRFLQNEAQYHCSDMGMYSMPGTTTVRPSLDAPTPNRSPAVYGPKTYLSCSLVDENGNAERVKKKSYVEKTAEDEAQSSTGTRNIGTRWSILTEPQTKFTPPIWFFP